MNFRLIIKYLTFEKAKSITEREVLLSETDETDCRLNRVLCKFTVDLFPRKL